MVPSILATDTANQRPGPEIRRVWILRLGHWKWLTPLRLTFIAAAVLTPVSALAGTPILTALIFAYALGITNYLINRQEDELTHLRPALTCDDARFNELLVSLSHHRRLLLAAAWVLGPVLMGAINYHGPGMTSLREGGHVDFSLIWGLSLATVFWITLFQLVVIFLSNSVTFYQVGARDVRLDLLDVGSLTPFARVGIRNILIFVGGYALLPLALFSGTEHLQAILISLLITVPIAIALLLLPMYSVRMRVGDEKAQELMRIQHAIHGDRSGLADSAICADADKIGFTGLILYRQMIQGINEWPVDFPVLARLSIYIIIPLLTWIGAALVEKLVDFLL